MLIIQTKSATPDNNEHSQECLTLQTLQTLQTNILLSFQKTVYAIISMFGSLTFGQYIKMWCKQLSAIGQLQIPLQSVTLECDDQSSRIAHLFCFLFNFSEACLTDMKSAPPLSHLVYGYLS